MSLLQSAVTFFVSKNFSLYFISGFLILLITIVLGRVFCGWICPLGTVFQFTGFCVEKFSKRNYSYNYDPKQVSKYLLLILFFFLFLFRLSLFGFFDPLALFQRSVTVGIYPVLQMVTEQILQLFLKSDNTTVYSISQSIYQFIRSHIFFTKQSFSFVSLIILCFFCFIVSSCFVRKRFWCKYVCPLGALLGIISRFSPKKLIIGEACIHCNACSLVCEGACNPHVKDNWVKHECLYCYNCVSICPVQVVSFTFSIKKTKPTLDLTRRRLLVSAVFSFALLPLLKAIKKDRINYLRPPGSSLEKDFMSLCVRCETCIKTCPTNFLHPSFFEQGLFGIFTPIGVAQHGYCNYACNLCGQVCPTHAIKNLSLQEKQRTKIGSAYIDKSKCLVHNFNVACLMCEEHCPVPSKAIHLYTDDPLNKNGLLKPYVLKELCIGCCICEHVCPAPGGVPAIQISASEE
ncbi:4Fe-4S binding protein [Chlamydiota bacterium]